MFQNFMMINKVIDILKPIHHFSPLLSSSIVAKDSGSNNILFFMIPWLHYRKKKVNQVESFLIWLDRYFQGKFCYEISFFSARIQEHSQVLKIFSSNKIICRVTNNFVSFMAMENYLCYPSQSMFFLWWPLALIYE